MSTIDPDSPRTWGLDTTGILRALGDADGDGYIVGWITADGTCWESRCEAEVATTAGRYQEAWSAWNRAGGVLGCEPDPAAFVARYCSPDSVDEGLRECREAAVFSAALAAPARSRAAQWN